MFVLLLSVYLIVWSLWDEKLVWFLRVVCYPFLLNYLLLWTCLIVLDVVGNIIYPKRFAECLWRGICGCSISFGLLTLKLSFFVYVWYIWYVGFACDQMNKCLFWITMLIDCGIEHVGWMRRKVLIFCARKMSIFHLLTIWFVGFIERWICCYFVIILVVIDWVLPLMHFWLIRNP